MTGGNDDCYVHYYIQQQNTAIAYESFLSTSAPGGETNDDSSLRAGGSEVRQQCNLCWNATVNQQSWEGPPSVWRHTDKHFEKGVKILVDIEKKTLGGFLAL